MKRGIARRQRVMGGSTGCRPRFSVRGHTRQAGGPAAERVAPGRFELRFRSVAKVRPLPALQAALAASGLGPCIVGAVATGAETSIDLPGVIVNPRRAERHVDPLTLALAAARANFQVVVSRGSRRSAPRRPPAVFLFCRGHVAVHPDGRNRR